MYPVLVISARCTCMSFREATTQLSVYNCRIESNVHVCFIKNSSV